MEPSLAGLISLVALIGLSGFFSTARAALGKARRHELRELAEDGDRRAQRALNAAEDSSRMINTFELAKLTAYFLLAGLLSILIVPQAAAWADLLIGGLSAAAIQLLSFVVIACAAAAIVYVLAELIPDVLVASSPEEWAMRIAGPALVVFALFSPLVRVMTALRRGLAGPLGGRVDSAQVTEEEIMTLVDAGEEEGSIEEEEKEMIYSIFQLDETLVREIMVPRIDVVAVEISTPIPQALEIITAAGHSRLPVYEGSLDQIRGMLYAKDLLELLKPGNSNRQLELKDLLRPALFVPETKRVMGLLSDLQAAKVHLAIVIDEYGGTAGLVTMEDIVEEIVGDIFDEYDEAEDALYEMVAPDEYLFDARIHLDDFNRLLDTDVPDELGDTLGGFIYGKLGKVPEVGESITTEDLRIEVLTVVDRRIRKVRVKRIEPEEGPEENRHAKTDKYHANGNGR